MSNQRIAPAIPTDPDPRPTPLSVVADLLDRLHASNIPYCHWTSNDQLGPVLAGEKDLDLLVDRGAASALARILIDTGFKRLISPPGQGDPGIEDHLAMDTATGKLIHLHLHYQLIVGRPHLKEHKLPWEDLILSTRVLDREAGIYTVDPPLALVLLVTRTVLQLRTRDLLYGALGRSCLKGGAIRKLRWLADRVAPDRLLETGHRLIGEEAARMLPSIVAGSPAASLLRAYRRRILRRLDAYRLYGRLEGPLERRRRELCAYWKMARRRYLPAHAPTKRVLPQGGVIIALIGADGSGKSTISREITRWLSWKMDVLPVYLGSGSGPVSLLRRPLRLYGSFRSLPLLRARWRPARHRKNRPSTTEDQPSNPAGNPVLPGRRVRFLCGRQLWHALWAWTLYREKRERLGRARRARNRGRVVVCDRYPQNQVMGFNDGPLLSPWIEHRSRILRALARREAAVYQAASTNPPDLVVRLVAAPEIAWQRKPERSLESLRVRVEATRELSFPPCTRVVEVDASQPLEVVLLEVKRAIWESL